MLYDWLYVVYSLDYSFLNIVWAKLLSMIFILLTGYQFSLLELSMPLFRKSKMFCLLRLSNTLNELWVSSSHTSWH